MKAKEFVKSKYPNAKAKKYRNHGPFNKAYWLIWSDYQSENPIRLSEGKTESNAWVNAKNNLRNK